jgi:uncharacterized OsmC-like protein
VSQVAAKKRLTLRDERIKVIAHFREEGAVLAGTQKGICEGFTIELFINGDMPHEEIITLIRLAHQMCFTESTLSHVVKLTLRHFFNDQRLDVD